MQAIYLKVNIIAKFNAWKYDLVMSKVVGKMTCLLDKDLCDCYTLIKIPMVNRLSLTRIQLMISSQLYQQRTDMYTMP